VPDFSRGQEEWAAGKRNPARSAVADSANYLKRIRPILPSTVYNSNIAALVRDVPRNCKLSAGKIFRLKFMDIAATRQSGDGAFSFVDRARTRSACSSRNYEYDLLEPAKLLNKYGR